MNEIDLVSKNPLVLTIVDGTAKDELLDMLVEKQLPFTEEEYLESLSFVIKNDRVKTTALARLKEIPESTKANYVEKSIANHRVVYFVILEALNRKSDQVIARAIRNQTLPPEFLVKIAERGSASMLEMLLDNQIKLIAYPEIMEMMEKNPGISKFIRGKIQEIRDYYLSEEAAEAIPAEAVIEDIKEGLITDGDEEKTDEDDMEILEEEDDMEDVEIEGKALTLLQEINRMSISERIKMAFTGTRTHRMILVKDPNKMVSLAVIESPKITNDEILLLARNRSLPMEVIGKISRNREWVKNYSIMYELVLNPKCPVKNALEFIKKLHARELKSVTRNKNISPVIRQLATNFAAQKDRR